MKEVYKMQTQYIVKSTNYVMDILNSNSPVKIHSIYENTVNLIVNNQILALQTHNTVISPISLITDANSFNINLNSKIYINNSCIFIDNFCFDYSQTEIIDSKMHKNTFNISCDMLIQAIYKADFSGFNAIFSSKTDIKDNFLILNAAKNKIDTCTSELLNKNFENSSDILSSLIGLGIGLTPSGDDFLCGVLAGCIFDNLEKHSFVKLLKKQIQNNLQNTNDISRAFLSCALNDNFSTPVLNLPYFKSPDEVYHNFKKIGHSSGIDTLCGIYYSLNTISKILKKDA